MHQEYYADGQETSLGLASSDLGRGFADDSWRLQLGPRRQYCQCHAEGLTLSLGF